MADRIKGITIEIDGDTKGLSQALNSVNKEIRDTQSGLKDINRLLKLDPGNSDLLKQKMSALSTEIGSVTSKLEQLRGVQAQMDAGLANGTITQAQYDAWQREIIETEGELRNLQRELTATEAVSESTVYAIGSGFESIGGKVESAGKAITELGNGMVSAGQTMTKYVTAPIVGGLGYAANAAVDWETAFTGVMKTVDETATTTYDDLAAGIQQMSMETAMSATDIAAVAEAAGQLGVGADDILTFVRTMVMLGDTTNLSADEAATALAKFANITGTPLSDVDKLGSAVVDLGNNFATTEADIVEMSTRLASAASIAGFTDRDILALSAAMSSVGIEAEAGGSNMSKTISQINSAIISYRANVAELQELQAQGLGDTEEALALEVEAYQGTAAAMAELAGMNVDSFAAMWESNPVDALQSFIKGLNSASEAGEDVVGILDAWEMSGIRQSNMLQALSLSFDNMGAAVDTANAAYADNTALTAEAEKRYGTTAAQMQQMKARIDELAVDIGETLLPMIIEVMEYLKPMIEDMKASWDAMSPEEQREVVESLVKLAAIGPAFVGVGKALVGIGKAVSFIGGGMKALGTAMKAISAAGGIKGILTSIGTSVSGWFSGLGASISAGISELGATLAAPVSSFASGLFGVIAGAFAGGGIADLLNRYVLGPIYEWAGSDFAEFYKNFSWFGEDGFFATVFGGYEDFNDWATTMLDAFRLMGEDAKAQLLDVKNSFEAIFKGIGILAEFYLGKLWEGIQFTLNSIKEFFVGVFTSVRDFMAGVWDAIVTKVTEVWTAISNNITAVWTTITTSVTTAIGGVRDTMAAVWDTITAKVTEVWTNVVTVFTNVKDTVTGIFQSIYDFIKGIWDSIAALFSGGFSIPLPHFSVNGSFSLAPPSVPTIGVDWYKDGGILTQPTIFGMSGGRLLGGGEAGPEAVLPLTALQDMINNGIAQVGGDTHITVQIGNDKLGSVLLTAQDMMNLRRGR